MLKGMVGVEEESDVSFPLQYVFLGTFAQTMNTIICPPAPPSWFKHVCVPAWLRWGGGLTLYYAYVLQ